jgi:hypothetical protein
VQLESIYVEKLGEFAVSEFKTLKSEVAELSGALLSPMIATEEIVAHALMLLMLAYRPARPRRADYKRDDWASEEVEALSQPSTAKRSHHRHAPICHAKRDEPWLN